MRGRAKKSCTQGSPAGFTLIEIMAVMLLIALLATFLLPDFGILSRVKLRHEAETLGATLELARARAVMTGKPHRMVLDLDARRYHLEWEVETLDEPLSNAGSEFAPPPRLMAAPSAERSFEPIPTQSGRATSLEEPISFEEIETSEGVLSQGSVYILFNRDGTTVPTTIYLTDGDNNRRALEVLALAETVRIFDAS